MLQHNPGGSLGDKKFPMPSFNTLNDLKDYMLRFHGYELTNNLFFKEKLNGKSIAEVGCGHGFMTLILAEYAMAVSGFDVDSDAILYAENMRKKFNVDNVEFYIIDEKLNVINTYEAAISMDVIEHVPNPVSYLNKINSMLEKGGKLYLGTPNGLIAKKNKCIIKTHSEFHVMEYNPSELISFLRYANFKPVAFYSNKNVSGKGYDISILKKTIIILLCKLGLFNSVRSIMKKVKEIKFYNNQTSENSIKDWVITPIDPDKINVHNCDVIIIEAVKQ